MAIRGLLGDCENFADGSFAALLTTTNLSNEIDCVVAEAKKFSLWHHSGMGIFC